MANTANRKRPKNSWGGYFVYLLAIAVVFLIIVYIMQGSERVQELNYNQVITQIQSEQVSEIKFSPATGDYNDVFYYIEMKSVDGKTTFTSYITKENYNVILNEIDKVNQNNKETNIAIINVPARSYGGWLVFLS